MDIGSDFEYPQAGLFGDIDPGQSLLLSDFPGEGQLVLTDSGRSSLRLGLRALGARSGGSVLVPVYVCESVTTAVRAEGFEPIFYSVSGDLCLNAEDILSHVKAGIAAVLLVDYFGFRPHLSVLHELVERKVPVLYDMSHSLLSSERNNIVRTADVVVASLRKLLPLPDGGLIYVRSGTLPAVAAAGAAPHSEIRTAAMLWKQAAAQSSGSSGRRGYRDLFLQAESILDCQSSVYPICAATRFLLKILAPDKISRARRANFLTLESAASTWNQIVKPLFESLPAGVCPLGYPVVLPSKEARDGLRSYLVSHSVFPPVHWLLDAEQVSGFPEANWLSSHILTIPVDHRYTSTEMERVSALITQWSSEHE